jgi:lycopene cyclase domain-containing protein
MPETHLTYLKWLTFLVCLPILVLWLTHWKALFMYRRTVTLCILSGLLFGIPWDYWAISTRIWEFPPENILGIWIIGIPLEEYLFLIFVTMLISTITLVLKTRLSHLVKVD